MTIWADADSLPAPVREILARRACLAGRARPAGRTGPDGSGTAEASTGVRVVFAAGRPIPVPPGSDFLLVETGDRTPWTRGSKPWPRRGTWW